MNKRDLKSLPTDMLIRQACLQDLPQLCTFEQGIIQSERPYDKTLKPDPISYYDIAELIKVNDAEVIVAELETKIIASGFAKIMPAKPFLQHEKYAYLGFMFVSPEFRGCGVNQLIIDELIKWSNAQGLKEVRLTVYSGNQSAIKAYEKAGFTQHLIEMRLLSE